jgi:peptidoglycan hydrolase-like protein with peptidoglycan-binding domain
VLASKEDPSQPGPYHLEFKFSEWKFWSPQPVVVKNAEHPGLLPSTEGDGLVILGGGAFNEVHLAWMKLDPVRGPLLSSVRYYTGNAEWSRPTEWAVSGGMDAEDQARANPAAATVHEAEVSAVVNLPPRFSSVSATWLPGPKQWMLLYSTAGFDADHPDQQKPTLPIVARFGPNPWTWSDEVEVFNPCRDRAYGHFMHWPGLDDIDRRVPPTLGSADAWAGEPGHAYGAFVLQRFTRWDAASKELSLAYLLSTFNPYQVQVMRTQLRLPVTMASSDPLPGASAGAILAEVQPPATLTASEVLPGASARAVLSELQQPTPTPVAYHAPSIISGWPQLSTLTQGEAVTSLQYLLQQSGATLAVDGKFGPQTDAAVRAFQQAKALGVDGIVGPNTWQALIVYLQQGDHGPAVRAVQSQLKSRGLALTVDGDFGAQTDAVVKAYQQSHDLTVDGQVGPQTWPVLLSGK